MAQLQFTLDSELVKGLFLGQAPDAIVPLLEAILNQFLQAMATDMTAELKLTTRAD